MSQNNCIEFVCEEFKKLPHLTGDKSQESKCLRNTPRRSRVIEAGASPVSTYASRYSQKRKQKVPQTQQPERTRAEKIKKSNSRKSRKLTKTGASPARFFDTVGCWKQCLYPNVLCVDPCLICFESQNQYHHSGIALTMFQLYNPEIPASRKTFPTISQYRRKIARMTGYNAKIMTPYEFAYYNSKNKPKFVSSYIWRKACLAIATKQIVIILFSVIT